MENKVQDSKLKPLSPTLREKKRFVKIKIESDKKFEFKTISEELVDQILVYIGAIDFSKAGIWILRDKFDYDKQELIIKVNVKYKDKFLASLLLLNKIDNNSVKIKTIKTSGTLKGVEN